MIMRPQTAWIRLLPDWAAGAVPGLLLGLLAIFISALIAILWLAIRRPANSATEQFKATLDFHLPPEQVFALCLASLKVVRRFEIQYWSENEGKLVARLPLTWVSTGETIAFQIANHKDGLTSLDIVSEQIVPTPAYGYQSTEKILEYLKNHGETKPQSHQSLAASTVC